MVLMASILVSLNGPVFKVANFFSSVANEVIADTAEYGRGIIADKTPVRTGRAQEGWEAQGNTIFNDVDYISFLEDGTRYMSANYMVRRSLPAIRQYAVKKAGSSLMKRLSQ